MALLENCRSEIVEYNGLNLIADFLNEQPSMYMQSNMQQQNGLNNSHGTNSSEMMLSSSLSSSFDYNNNNHNNSSQNVCYVNSSNHSSGNLNSSNGSAKPPQQQPMCYEPELLACERVQQKSAIAISRFCKEKQYTMGLIDLGVVARLVTICRNSHERNNSDSVLVACLVSHKLTLLELYQSKKHQPPSFSSSSGCAETTGRELWLKTATGCRCSTAHQTKTQGFILHLLIGRELRLIGMTHRQSVLTERGIVTSCL